MKLKATKQSTTGLNTEFVNIDSGRHVSLEHAIKQIEKGNPNYRLNILRWQSHPIS